MVFKSLDALWMPGQVRLEWGLEVHDCRVSERVCPSLRRMNRAVNQYQIIETRILES
jgi:hypothetical protein